MTHKPLFLILGWDASAQFVARILLAQGGGVTVVGRDTWDALPADVRTVHGRPDDPESLNEAGVQRASAVLSCLSADEARRAIGVALSMNPRIIVVASLQAKDARASLAEAGAQVIIDVREEAGREMARLLLSESRPSRNGSS